MSKIPDEEMKTDEWGDSIQWDDSEDWNLSSDTTNSWGIIPNLGESFIVLFEDKKTFLGSVNDVENSEGKYFTLKNKEKSLLFQTEENGVVKMKTDDYEILDIQKIKKYDMKLLELPESVEEKLNESSEIAYTLVDDKNRIYSKQELKEMLISTLYTQYNKESETKTMTEIIESADILLEISGEKISKHTHGNWYVPIITNETKIISEENEIYDEIKDLIDNDKLITDKNTKQDKNYVGLMKNLLHLWDNIIHDENNDGLLINDYEGKMYRNCLDMNNCSGINGLYSFDEIRNNRSFKVPTSFDRISGDSNYLEIRKPMKVNITGILTIPYHHFPFLSENLLSTDKLTLYEKCILQELFKQTNIQKRNGFKNNTINTKEHNSDHNYEINSFTIHNLNSNNKEELIKNINDIKPSVKDILQSLDDKIVKSLKNYQDIAKLLINYEINYNELDDDYKYINNILTQNTLTDSKDPKLFRLKHKPVIKKELNIESRIKISKEIIFGMLNISSRNLLIKRFIDTFCVDSSDESDWYVGIHDKKRLLCKHYSYLSGEKDTNAFFMMKQKYQRLPPEDGNIYCKNCGEFICQEEFSHDDGFSDDLPAPTKEVLIQEKDPFEKYDESDMNNIGLLKNISQGLGVELKDEDIVIIVDIYSSLSEDIVANKRYNTLNITKSDEHPRVSEIKKKYSKDKKKMSKSIKSFQIFLKVTNRIMVFISLSLMIIATSIPLYENKYIEEFKLFNEDNTINKDFVGKLALILNKISYTFGEKYEKIYKELYNEKKSFEVTNVQDQIVNLIDFFTSSSFPKIISRLGDYTRFKQIVNNTYINYEWPIYKPLTNNKLIAHINNIVKGDKISEGLRLKTYNNVNIENITGISGIDDYELHKAYDIQKNSLINTAFQRIFNLTVSLHGKLEKPNFYLDTNVEKFFNESDDDIKDICIKSGWNDKTKTMGPINFKELRKNFIPKIMKVFHEKSNNDLTPCFTLKEKCNDYIHININNYDLSMMNTESKRFYKHYIPDIFPSVNYSIIKDVIKEKIFKTFAFDPTNKVIKKELSTQYLGKFLIDISNVSDITVEEKSSDYEKDIPKNEKNFHKIIDYLHINSRLVSSYINLPHDITGDSLRNISNNIYITEIFSLLEDKDYEFDVERFIKILEIIEENKENIKDVKKELTEIYLQIEEKNDEILISSSSLLKMYFDNNQTFKSRFQNIFIPGRKTHIKIYEDMRKKLESFGQINYQNLTDKNIEDIFRILIENEHFDLEYINDISSEILYIISNIINSGHKNSHIPKSWKLSDVNKSWYKKYVETHYFSQHRDIYTKNNFKDFSEYFGKATPHFVELFKNIQKLTKNINTQRNIIGVLTENIKSLWKYVYLTIIRELLSFSDNLRNELNINENDEENADIIEKFSLDLIIHLFEKRYDITWIYSNKENLSELLGVQKEREKQKLIHKLDGMSNDKRHATTELHTIGTKNHFKASEIENMEYIEDESYKNENDDLSYINEVMNGQTLTEVNYVVEDDLANDNYDTGEQIDEDGGDM